MRYLGNSIREMIPSKEELKKDRQGLEGLSEEFYEYGTLTRFDYDRIQHALQFTDRINRDGILTYERDCQEIKKIQLPYSALFELLDSMPTEQTMWSLAKIELEKLQNLIEKKE